MLEMCSLFGRLGSPEKTPSRSVGLTRVLGLSVGPRYPVRSKLKSLGEKLCLLWKKSSFDEPLELSDPESPSLVLDLMMSADSVGPY